MVVFSSFPTVFARSKSFKFVDRYSRNALHVIFNVCTLLQLLGTDASVGTCDLVRVLMARADVNDPTTGDVILNAGDALLEYSDLESAEKCFEELRGRKYENKVVAMVSVDEEQWQQTILPILLEMNDDDDE